tara:strand:+ start:401 stop:979 length:579 start_codon:yes stop_codon:yes gene_type:complete
MKEIVFATNNHNKFNEIKFIFPKNIKLLSLKDLNINEKIEENGKTLEDNAKIKSDYIYDKYSLFCFSDDSGLMIDYLNGEPGIYSSEYAGFPSNDLNNMRKVLNKLKNINNRMANFKTIISLNLGLKNLIFTGELQGSISNSIRGDNGFGYDPIFIPKGYNLTLGELSFKKKNTISHRNLAIKKLINYLNNL